MHDAEPPQLASRLHDLDADAWGVDDPDASLVELINRVLDRGVVITGEVTISVAGVDLVYLGLNAVLTSVSSARRMRRGDGAPRGEP